MKRFLLTCSAILMTTSIGALAEPLVLNADAMDSVTAGGVGGVDVRAFATGTRPYTYTISHAVATGNPLTGLPRGTGTVIIKTHGTGFASGTGMDSSSSSSISSTNEQLGASLSSRPMNINVTGRFRSISVHNQLTVGGTFVDLYFMALRDANLQ